MCVFACVFACMRVRARAHACVCLCMCVCVYEIERERDLRHLSETRRHYVRVCVCMCVLFLNLTRFTRDMTHSTEQEATLVWSVAVCQTPKFLFCDA